jgi:hypothetical protein
VIQARLMARGSTCWPSQRAMATTATTTPSG